MTNKNLPIDNEKLTELFFKYAKQCRATWVKGKSPHKNGRPYNNTKPHVYPWPDTELLTMLLRVIDGLFLLPRYSNDPDVEDMRQHAIVFITNKAHAFKTPDNAHSYVTAIIKSAVGDYRRTRRRGWGRVNFVDPTNPHDDNNH